MAPKAFVGPTGAELYAPELRLICDMERNGTIAWSDEEVTFNSGFKSHVYFRARNDLSENPALLERVAWTIKKFVDGFQRTHGPQLCLIGIPTAGTQLAQAVSHLSCREARRDGQYVPIYFRTMRTALKDHGKDQMWVGEPDFKKHSYATVENVVSTVKAMLEAFGRLETDGYPTKEMLHVVFADWELGGISALNKAGYRNVTTLFSMRDIMAALVHTNTWPREYYKEMERRINEWNRSKQAA